MADFVHKQRPEVLQHILDLALIKPARRLGALARHLTEFRPEVVAFSWRNMQSFGPHPEDGALNAVMALDYAAYPWRRLQAAVEGLSIVYDYAASRRENFRYIHLAHQLLPGSRVLVGGTAATLFASYIAARVPADTVVAVGEGEETMLSALEATRPRTEHYYKDHAGSVTHFQAHDTFQLDSLLAVDFRYIKSIFPGFLDYANHRLGIGVNTKRGCPYRCGFCLYNRIEGRRQRYRAPVEIAKEVESLNKDYGVKRVWFTDAQFCSTQGSTAHASKVLDEMISRRIQIGWRAYLRFEHLTAETVRKMLATGLEAVDVPFTGAQDVIDELQMDYSVAQQMEALRLFKDNGYRGQTIRLHLPLNAPGETPRTLKQTIAAVREIYRIFGRPNVFPFPFFIGVQPNTPIEERLIETGYLRRGYDPLTIHPLVMKRLLYNPPPLGPVIGRAYLKAMALASEKKDDVGRALLDILDRALEA